MSSPDNTIGCLEAERALLGVLLQAGSHAKSWVPLLTLLEPADFTDPRHRETLDAVGRLHDRGLAADPVAVLGELRRDGRVACTTAAKSAGVYLADLVGSGNPGSLPVYIYVVLEHRLRRDLQEWTTRLQQAAEQSSFEALRAVLGDTLEIITRHLDRLDCALAGIR